MKTCYPIIQADVGAEKADAMLSAAMSKLFDRYGDLMYKYDVLVAMPREVEIGKYRILEPGRCYLVEERKSEHTFGMFADMLRYGFPGLCISTTYPADLKEKYKLGEKATSLWLSKIERDYAISPWNLGLLRDRISAFVKRSKGGVVLLDGLEYLVTTNGFDLTLKFLHDVRESIVVNRARLLIPVTPRAFEAKELELLERYMEPIEVVEE